MRWGRSGVAALAVAVALGGCALVPPSTPPVPGSSSPRPGASTAGPAAPATPADAVPALVYYPRPSTRGFRLGREQRMVPRADPLRGALEAMIAGPTDPDYTDGWAEGTRVLSASTSAGVTTVDLSAEGRVSRLPPDAARAQVDQVLWTVTETVGPDTAVQLTFEGVPAGSLWGVTDWLSPRTRDDVYAARTLVGIDLPLQGAVVSSPLTVSGNAAVFEATLPWRVLDASGAEVRRGVAKTQEGNTFADYAFTVPLDPGTYTVEVTEEASDGEGWKPDVDTRTFTVR